MKKHFFRSAIIFTLFLLLAMIGLTASKYNNRYRILEAYPDDIQAKLEIRSRIFNELSSQAGSMQIKSVFFKMNRWTPGETLSVAFLDGNSQLHADIASIASEWTKYGNIKLDFGYNPATGRYRKWSRSDMEYKAHIRISFNEKGYWSQVGMDSIDLNVSKPSEASMNFADFNVERPDGWKAAVLHEFGHSLGFEHEHQHPTEGCNNDFRWEDDPGYVATTDKSGCYIPDINSKKPGIYIVLGGYPNFWPRSKVKSCLRQFADSESLSTTPFDRKSIMVYFFPDWMYIKGQESHCYNEENFVLSDGDKKAMALAYPSAKEEIDRSTKEKIRYLVEILKYRFTNSNIENEFKKRLEKIK